MTFVGFGTFRLSLPDPVSYSSTVFAEDASICRSLCLCVCLVHQALSVKWRQFIIWLDDLIKPEILTLNYYYYYSFFHGLNGYAFSSETKLLYLRVLQLLDVMW